MKTIFITGGASGIGLATSEKLIEDGNRVVCFDKDKEAGLRLAERFPSQNLLYFCGDVSDIRSIEESIEQALDHFGSLDGVVANAGIYEHKALLDMSEDEWDRVMAVNLKGTAFTVRAALPHLIQQKHGSVVLLGSDQSIVSKPRNFAYAVSKGGIAQMAKSIAIDYGAQNIRANAVCPGTINTPMVNSIVHEWSLDSNKNVEDLKQIIAKENSLHRIGSANEVAELICFLLSDKASFITGALYTVDGGYTAK